MPQDVDRYTTRELGKNYYQKLAWKGNKVVAVSGYKRQAGKDEKIYEKLV